MKKLSEFFTDESRWCKGEFWKRDRDGKIRCACISGGVLLVAGNDAVRASDIEQKMRSFIGGVPLAVWNDAPERTFADIQALIAKVES